MPEFYEQLFHFKSFKDTQERKLQYSLYHSTFIQISKCERKQYRKKKQQKKSVKFPPNILMQQAITDGDVQEIKQLIINYGKEVVNASEPTGLPSVMCCIFEGQMAPLELLVAAEADLNSTTQ